MVAVVAAFLVAAVLFFRAERRWPTWGFLIGTSGELLFQLWQLIQSRMVPESESLDLKRFALHQGISFFFWCLMAYGLVSIAYVAFRRKMLETPHDDGLQ